jgi:hypothetical protein
MAKVQYIDIVCVGCHKRSEKEVKKVFAPKTFIDGRKKPA